MIFILVRLLESHPAVVGTARKIQPLHLLHCPQPFLVPLLKQNGFMFFHRLVIPLRSYLFFQFRSRLVHKIEWPILLRTLDSFRGAKSIIGKTIIWLCHFGLCSNRSYCIVCPNDGLFDLIRIPSSLVIVYGGWISRKGSLWLD